MRWSCFFVFALISLGSVHFTARAAQAKSAYLAGPVLGYLERVIDGDTIRARALIWLRQEVRITIRLNGVDTPELRGSCDYEIALAHKARQFTSDWLSTGPTKPPSSEAEGICGLAALEGSVFTRNAGES